VQVVGSLAGADLSAWAMPPVRGTETLLATDEVIQ
jgi:hypothetical protein